MDIQKRYRFTEKQKNVKERLNISEKADSAQNATTVYLGTDGNVLEEKAENCEEVEMKYSEYKENHADCKTKAGSYDKETKTIVVYVPKQEEMKEDSREVFGKALNAALEELKGENENAKPEEVTPVMIARELNKMGYTEEELKKMKDVPETVMKDVLEKKEEWTR